MQRYGLLGKPQKTKYLLLIYILISQGISDRAGAPGPTKASADARPGGWRIGAGFGSERRGGSSR
ncbi:hypothetical protein EAH73_13770 [Hymenobacter nivis]|uniref:Uncharacterized protein n=1 Tax=Hymenobacter nivis TaxID=1850093 RepID=A0A502GV61_9BACT|nr:hypothetical protein EAH73_13770 [Hymenobacter nivis]